MADSTWTIRRGERRFFKGIATALLSSDTLTISPTPAPTVTIYDSANAVLPDFSAIGVSGYVAGPLQEVYVYYGLDTTTPVAFAAGYVTMVFKFTAIGSDGQSRVYEPSVLIRIAEPWE